MALPTLPSADCLFCVWMTRPVEALLETRRVMEQEAHDQCTPQPAEPIKQFGRASSFFLINCASFRGF